MKVTFERKSELVEFVNRFNGEGYFVAVSFDKPYKMIEYRLLGQAVEVMEPDMFPMDLEFGKNMMQLNGVLVEKDGKKDVVFTTYDEAVEVAERLNGTVLCRTFCLDDICEQGRTFRQVLDPALSEKTLDYLKRELLTDKRAMRR